MWPGVLAMIAISFTGKLFHLCVFAD
jgi:OPT oligopeptide transporter protein